MMDAILFNPPGERPRGRSASTVQETLRDEIIDLTLPPGTVLARNALQARFGLSSTPLRDALMRLQEEGLVDIFPQHATVVSRIDVRRARQAQFLRRSIELEIVYGLAQHRDAALIAALRELIRRQEAFAGLGELQAFSAADQAFHFAMYEAAQVSGLWLVVRRESGHIDRLRRLNLPVEGKMREILKAHARIVDALEAGDGGGAQDALRDHLSRSLEFVGTLRETHPDYFIA
ncbi:MAG: GntR family transcriptional regulator [Beijerinckiaceae bacterium]